MKQLTLQKKLRVIKELVRTIFKNSKTQPYELTTGQALIFLSVIDPSLKWLWLSAPTRYGKTDVLSMAILYLASYKKLKIPIVGGSEDKAKKIMEYVVAHLADDPSLYAGLINVIDARDVDKLKVTVSKDALRWRDGGWIYVTSVDSRGIASQGEKVIGEGGDVVLLEEAGLIKQKEQFSKVVRMSEEDKGWGKLVMSGNCIEKSVFEDAYNDPLFHKIRIGLDQAIEEKRFTKEVLEQKKTMTTSKDWKRLYLVEFPKANEFTYFKPKKYQYLPTGGLKYYGAIDLALGEAKKGSLVGITVLGADANGQVYEADSIGIQMKPDDIIRTIFNLPYKFTRFGIEAVQFQKYFLQTIEAKSKLEKRYIPFEGIQQNKKKEERIESIEPFINTAQILFKGDNLLWEHMQDYPNSEYLDILDSLEMCWRLIHGKSFSFEIL